MKAATATRDTIQNTQEEALAKQILATPDRGSEALARDVDAFESLLGRHWSLFESMHYATLIDGLKEQGRLTPEIERAYETKREAEAQAFADFAKNVTRHGRKRFFAAMGIGVLGIAGVALAPLAGIGVIPQLVGLFGASIGMSVGGARAIESNSRDFFRWGINEFEAGLEKFE